VRKSVLVLALVSGIALGVAGCPFSTSVPESDIVGEHIAEYEFGTDKLVLMPGGEFQQTITVGDDAISRRGRWRTDGDKLALVGWTEVADPFGKLNAGWQRLVVSGEVTMSVERIWYRVVVGSGATVPYRKVD